MVAPLFRHVALVGMMGSGKTTVGTQLAEGLGRRFVDSDAQVEARTGRTVREIFEHDGEQAYRVLEAEALADALDAEEPSVIAAAGGVVLDPENRRRLNQGAWVVWLRADPEVLAGRLLPSGGERAPSDPDHRPLLADDPEGTLRRLTTEREALYAEVADTTVEVTSRSVDEVLLSISEWLRT